MNTKPGSDRAYGCDRSLGTTCLFPPLTYAPCPSHEFLVFHSYTPRFPLIYIDTDVDIDKDMDIDIAKDIDIDR